jgi:hypothetical protein
MLGIISDMLRAASIITKQGLLQLDNVSLGPVTYLRLKTHDDVTGIVVKGGVWVALHV